jgi:hypothetical protein
MRGDTTTLAITLADVITRVADYDLEVAVRTAQAARELDAWWDMVAQLVDGVDEIGSELRAQTITLLRSRLQRPNPFEGLPRW